MGFRTICGVLLTVLAGAAAARAEPRPRTDRYGDPLPAGALVRLGTVRLRHSSPVQAIAFSPDGRHVASGGNDRTRLWDVSTGRLAYTFDWPARPLAFSPDGRRLTALGTSQGRGPVVWDVATGETIYRQIFHGPIPWDGVCTWDSAFVLICDDDKRLSLLDVLAREKIADFAIDEPLRETTFCVSPEGGLLAWALCKASNTSSLHVWSVHTREPRFAIELDGPGRIMALAFTPDCRELVSAAYRLGPEGPFVEVCSWDVASGEPSRRFACGPLGAIAFSAGAALVACSSRDEIAIWDVRQREPIARIRRHWPTEGFAEHGLAFSPDGKTIASKCGDRGVCLWDVETGEPLVPLPESCPYAVTAVAIGPDAEQVATGSRDGVVRIWSGSTGRELRRLPWGNGPISSIRITSDGKTLAACGSVGATPRTLTGQVKLWDLPSGELRRTIHTGKRFYDSAISADDTTLAVGSGYWGSGKGFVVELAGGTMTAGLPPSRGWTPYALTVSPEGKVVSCLTFPDLTIRHWDLLRRQETATPLSLPPRFRAMHLISDAVFTRGCERLIASSHRFLHVIDATTGELLRQVKVPTCRNSRLALSPDGRLLARGGRPQNFLGQFDPSIRLHDWQTGREVLTLQPLDTATACLRFSRDGRYLVSGMFNGTALLWDVAVESGARDPSRRTRPEPQ